MAQKILGMLHSMGNSLDLFGVGAETPRLHRYEQTILGAFVNDADALGGDWRRVGNDIKIAWLADIHGSKERSARKASA